MNKRELETLAAYDRNPAVLLVKCPRCHARPSTHCRSSNGNVTLPHIPRKNFAERGWHPAAPLKPEQEKVVAEAYAKLLRGELEQWAIDSTTGGYCIDIDGGELEALQVGAAHYGEKLKGVRRVGPSGVYGCFRPAGIEPAVDLAPRPELPRQLMAYNPGEYQRTMRLRREEGEKKRAALELAIFDQTQGQMELF